MVFQSAPRQTQEVMRLDGMVLRLADHEDSRSLGLRRAWNVQRVKRQDGDPEQEFSLALSLFNMGYGYSFGLTPGTYESAHQFDASAFNKAKTWGKMASAAPVESGTRRGWLYFHSPSGYLYLFRGRYAVKYLIGPASGVPWEVIEYHDFGPHRAVAGRWAEFNGMTYVPLIDTTDGTEQRFQQLAVVNNPVTGVQTLTMTGSPTGGTFTIAFDSGYGPNLTGPLPFDASAEDVQAALRALPGLQQVTVERAGSATNFEWTVTLTGAPAELGSGDVPELIVDDTGLTGGTSPEIAVATVANGEGDVWRLGPDTVTARYFTEWNKPGAGPVLARAYENFVSVVADDPMEAGDWGAPLAAGSSTYRINAIATLDRYLVIGKQDVLGIFDEQGDFVPQIASISGVASEGNFVGMLEHNNAMFMPHKLGLIRWRIGEQYRFVGAEQDGMLEADRPGAAGFGRVTAVAPYGRHLYETVFDERSSGSRSVIASLQEPGSELRGPLTPQMHFNHGGVPEDLITLSFAQIQTMIALSAAVSDGAQGEVEWASPANALVDDATYAAAGPGETEYLKVTNVAGEYVPPEASIIGFRVRVRRSAPLTRRIG